MKQEALCLLRQLSALMKECGQTHEARELESCRESLLACAEGTAEFSSALSKIDKRLFGMGSITDVSLRSLDPIVTFEKTAGRLVDFIEEWGRLVGDNNANH